MDLFKKFGDLKLCKTEDITHCANMETTNRDVEELYKGKGGNQNRNQNKGG